MQLGRVHPRSRPNNANRCAVLAVRAMTERYGSRPAEIVAGIGPSIGPCHYEVGPEVAAQTRAAFNGHALVIARSPITPGSFTVTVTAAGLGYQYLHIAAR